MDPQSVSSILGGKRALGRQIHSAIDFAELIEKGSPNSAAHRLKLRLQLTDSEFAKCLGISAKTLQRQLDRDESALAPAPSDRLIRLTQLLSLAENVFENRKRATRWLQQQQRGLGNRVPLVLASTEAGAREIEDLLGRIEFGIFS